MAELERDGAAALVRRALELVGELRMAEVLALTSDDLVLELPFRADGGPRRMDGPDAHRFMGSTMLKLFQRMDLYDIVVHGANEQGWVAAEYRSNGLTYAGRPYPNVYAAFLRVEDGIITHWREYFDPDVVRRAFAEPQEGS